MRNYIAYGSNMNLSQMAKRCPKARKLGTGIIGDYKLIIPGVATIVPEKDNFVPVVIWEITPQCEKSLDIYEGYPRVYRKENIKVLTTAGKEITGMAYILNDEYCDVNRKPTAAYLNTIIEGYCENKIQGYGIEFIEERKV